MEGGDQNIGGGGARWNPTKEQINMLENLYKQGLRTPSAEQIHQITVRLKAFGHIEGKNVFYWFQNHKARQRQKQKQENVAYFNRFLQPTPVFPSSYQNVVCSPCYMPLPQNHLGGLYQQYPKVPLPEAGGGYKRRLIPDISMEYNKVMHKNEELQSIKNTYDNHQETLDLFPMHPTGILQAKNKNENIDTDENDCSTTPSTGPSCSEHDQPFFDFFYRN